MIEVNHLSKQYGPVTAIRDVNFRAEQGEVLGFLGPNGAGKSTTMRILAGCLAPTGGTARIAGHDLFQESLEARRSLGYLPEQVPLYPEMRVREYLNFSGRLHGMAARPLRPRVDEVLERCGLTHMAERLIGRLSRGYRQRVGLAQAILHNPPVLVLDEPTVGLDPNQIIEVRELIRSLAGDHTVLLSTHILPEVSVICSRVVIIHRGQVAANLRLEPGGLVVDTTTSPGERDQTFHVEILGKQEGAEECIRSAAGVIDASPRAVNGKRIFRVRASRDDQEDGRVRAAVARALVRKGYDLVELEPERRTLEDLFVKLTTAEPA